MRRYQTRHQLLAVGLTILAGFVDALGFLKLRGMFVSFMSGNSTRIAVGAATPVHGSLFAAALIAAFVVGVMLGTAVGMRAALRRRKQMVLVLVMGILTIACLAAMLANQTILPPLLMAGAMGSANAVFQRDGEVSVGVTYMTGTIVKLGQHLTFALSGGPRFAWVPYLMLWCGLMAGAVAGSAAFSTFGLQALWFAVAFTASLLVLAESPCPLSANE